MMISSRDGDVSVFVPGFHPIKTFRVFLAARDALKRGVTPEQIIGAAHGTCVKVKIDGKESN